MKDNYEYQYYEDGISITEIIKNIFRHKYLVLAIMLVSLLAAVFYLKITEYQYKSTVTILVDPMKKSSTIGSVLSSDFFDSSDDITTEVQLLTNVSNLTSALSTLDLEQYVTSDDVSYASLPISSLYSGKVSVSLLKDTNIVEVSVTDTNPEFAADFANALSDSFNKLLFEFSTDSKNMQIEFLEKQIPQVELEVKEASDKLFDYKFETGIDFLSNNAATLVNNISYLQMKKKPLELENYKYLVQIEDYQKYYDNKLLTLDEIKSDEIISTNLENYQAAYHEVTFFDLSSNINSWNTTNLSVVNDNLNVDTNSRISELNNIISESKRLILKRLDDIIINYNLNNDDIKYSINKYNLILLNTLTSEIDLINIDDSISNFEQEFNKLPIIEKEISKLQSDVDSLEAIRKELNSMLEQVSLTAAANTNSVKVVSPAIIPKYPVSPNRLLILAVSVLLGAALAVLVCLLLQMLDDTIHSFDELKNVVDDRVQILGWIPFVTINKKAIKNKSEEEKNNIIHKEFQKSYISERYKLIASNLLYGKNKQNKIYAITSSSINEGKSHFTSNIGINLAKNGYKVLIIDGDLKCPTIAKHFGLRNQKDGFIKAIQEDKSLREILVKPMKDYNLYIASPGKSEINPSVFYKNTDYNKIISSLRKYYDYILLDLPPLEFATNLYRFIDDIDSIILCARLSIITKSSINILFENLDEFKEKIGGIVATGCCIESVEKYISNYKSYYKNYSYTTNSRIEADSYFTIVRKEKTVQYIYKSSLKRRNR